MKRTVKVNIAETIFYLDEDAYDLLNRYLHKVGNYFGDTPEGKEIIADIESRIAELFQDKINAMKQVIVIEDVHHVIETMGQPEEFGDKISYTTAGKSKRPKGDSGSTRRRIYRDPDNRIFGGVCSGLAAYLGVEPIVFRIIFVIAALLFGSSILIYLLLWIVLPEAKTTVQKLEMKGEPVNISNIAASVKEEFKNVRENIGL